MSLFAAFDSSFRKHCADSARARSCRVALGALLSILLIVPVASLADYDRDQCRIKPKTNPQGCITKPHDYVRHWRNKTVQCVDPSLHGSSVGMLESQDGKLHHTQQDLAWVVSHQNLEDWLEFRCRFHRPVDLFAAIADNIGFAGAPLDGLFHALDPGQFVVFTPDAFQGPPPVSFQGFAVPTYAFWFQLLEDDYDFVVPLDVQKLITKEYTNLPFRKNAKFEDQYDYWGVYAKITGCTPKRWSGERYEVISPTDDCKRAKGAVTAIGGKVTGDKKSTVTTRKCMNKLRKNFPRHASTKTQAAWIRIGIDLCHDANSNNTGVGLGWAPGPNPQLGRKKWRRQTVAEKLTGREFVIPNRKLKGWYETSKWGRGWAVFEFDAEISDQRVNYRHGFPSK